VDFAMKIPVNLKLAKLQEIVRINENVVGDKAQLYYQKAHDGKMILRKAMEKFMPHEYIYGAKQGFSSPDHSWFKGDSVEFMKKKLFDANAPIFEYLDYEATCALVMEHLSGQENRRLFIWALLNINEWISHFTHCADDTHVCA
jgi:asparagine synthase (glutamine-hydrolysing)